MTTLNAEFILSIFKKRTENSHKGNFGHALLIAGNTSKIGAALIAAKACLRSGIGLLTVSIPKNEKFSLNTFLPEAMLHFREKKIDFSLYNVVGIGPGLGTKKASEQLVENTLSNANYPMVLDADALNIIGKIPELFQKIPKDSILTPHPKEFDRLFGEHQSDAKRKETAIQKATELNCIIVLKGHKTFITDGTNSYENSTGNSGLAKGGSGDALTGIITALLAQEYTSINSAILGVYIHGLAADLTLKNQSTESMLITDVIENIGNAFKQIQS
jgi:NAD(P)H-hydrate epimerase